MKRLISANASEILSMNAQELKQSIKASEGRVILSENVAPRESFIGDITNAEIARAFGADMILLNCLDVLNPYIFGLEHDKDNFVDELHRLVGRPIGVNLEPVDLEAEMLEDRLDIAKGRQLNLETVKRLDEVGFDFVCLTGNPGTGVTNEQIEKAISFTKENFSGLIIAGKMHGAGSDEPVADLEIAKRFVKAGADVILVPAVGTVPGFDMDDLKAVCKEVHSCGGLVLSAIGTSQEGSDTDTIKDIAIMNKICGVNIQHIGDAGYGGVAPVENIMAISKAVRGVRHTVSMWLVQLIVNMEQKVILLACAAGMSTSLLVTKMQEVSKKDKIFAIPVSKVDQKVNEESIDVILIGPQIRYMEKRIKEKMAVKHIPVGVIPMEDYGRMDGTKVLKYAYSLMNKG